MKTVSQHIAHIKSQPHHIRKRVAFGAAFAGTAVIAFAWLAVSLGTGSFALKDTSFAQNAENKSDSAVSKDNNEQFAGVGAASVLREKNEPARIEIIDASPSKPSVNKAEQTVIPF